MNSLLKNIKSFFAEGPIGIYLMAFFIPLNPKLLGIGVAIIIVEQLIRAPKVNKDQLKDQLTWKNPGIWLLLFYLMHVVGLVHTENMGFANMDLGMKATLGILPVFFLLYKLKVNWNSFVKVFILGAFVSIVYNFFMSLGVYLKSPHFYYLSGERLSHLMHRGYWAVYLVIAYFFLLKQMISAKGKLSFLLNLLGAIIMAIFVEISESKAGLILLILISFWAVYSLFKLFKNKWIFPITVIILVSGMAAVVFLTPSIFVRVNKAVETTFQPIGSFNKEVPESTEARIMVWDSSLELIRENFWFGVGTGDIKDELINKNIENGYSGIAELKLNSHNQFFNSHIALGVFGSLFLFLAIAMNFLKFNSDQFRGWRMGIITILFIALLPESMLETQAGIIPYAFFISFLTAFEPKPEV